MPAGHLTVLAAVIEEILVLCSVCLVFDALIAIQSDAADRAFDDAGEKMNLFAFALIHALIFLCL